jgi:hypothetical protein
VDLLAERIVRRGLEDRAEVRSELSRHAQIRLLAEQDVLVQLIDPRQVPKQVADVGPDAEIVKLSGIYRDSHEAII